MNKPNIIIFNPDQMRADALHHLGNEAAYTPNFDNLAYEGVSFSNAFCQNPVCVPSRCSFMTGLYPHTNGHRTMANLLKDGEDNLFADMKNIGYRTLSSSRGDLMAGDDTKYHRKCIDKYIANRRKISERCPIPFNDRGEEDSDTFFSFLGGVQKSKRKDGKVFNPDDFIINGAVHEIEHRKKDKPFFMFLGLMNPHPEYQVEEEFLKLIDESKLTPRIPNISENDGKPKMETGLMKALRVSSWSEERLKEIRKIYLGMCAKVDSQLGRIVAVLKKEGIYDETAIIVISDHGDYTTDYGIVEKAQNCFPDCLTNVPFIVKLPKSFQVDKGINSSLIELTDLTALCHDIAGESISRVQFGKSPMETIRNKNTPHRDFVVCEGGRLKGETHCMEYREKGFNPKNLYAPRMLLQKKEDGTHTKAVMIRDTKYKYIKRLYEKDEFYDLSKGERFNLIDDEQYKGITEAFDKKLLQWFFETSDSVPKKLDERFPIEFITNMAHSYGAPKAVTVPLKGLMRLIGFKISRFIR